MYKQLKEILTGINYYLKGIFIYDEAADIEKDLTEIANKNE
jgi:hypothetical protein